MGELNSTPGRQAVPLAFAKTSKVQRWAFQVTSSDGVPPRIPGFLRGEIPNP